MQSCIRASLRDARRGRRGVGRGRGGGAAGRGGGRRTRVIQSSCRVTSRIMHARHPVGSTARAERLIWAPTVRDSAFSVQMAGGFAQPGSRRCGRGRAMRSLPPLGAPTPHPSCVFDGFAHLGSGTLSTGRVPAGGGGCVSCGSAPRCAQPQGCSGKRCRAVKNATAVGAALIERAVFGPFAALDPESRTLGNPFRSCSPSRDAGRGLNRTRYGVSSLETGQSRTVDDPSFRVRHRGGPVLPGSEAHLRPPSNAD